MIIPYEDHRRPDYGYTRMSDTDSLMAIFLDSGKRHVVYWAEHIKHSTNHYMTFDTFKTRVRNYLRRTKQRLSAHQLQRIRISDKQARRYLELYLQFKSAKMNKSIFFEEYIIVPPYNTVPSYEMFNILIDRQLQELEIQRAPIVLSNADCDSAILGQQITTEAAALPFLDNLEQQQSATNSEETVTDSVEAVTDSEEGGDNALHSQFTAVVEKTEPASRVQTIYKSIRQVTGTLGGDGNGGPIYGELTEGNMQKIVDFLVAFCALNLNSRFLDIGAGQGKPNFHVAQNPGVRLSLGIEVEPVRWIVS